MLYVTNILEALKSAAVNVETINDIIKKVKKGVYLTVAVKESRKGLVVPPRIEHSYVLEEELKCFPHTYQRGKTFL